MTEPPGYLGDASAPFLVLESQTFRYVGIAILAVGSTLGGPLGIVAVVQEMIRAERRRQWMYIGIGALLSIPVGVFVNWIS
ncbi:hypothetical protein [Microtetraspora fusca]|uniref:hypothetical protein n=1 Tax=Microtetraspora fusca TaxID=1997 RepID=UPI00082E7857|nr:hypothetical protein [Microtetraspora fusca]